VIPTKIPPWSVAFVLLPIAVSFGAPSAAALGSLPRGQATASSPQNARSTPAQMAPSQPPPERPYPRIVERPEFTFELSSCVKEDTRAVCDYSITNKTPSDLKINVGERVSLDCQGRPESKTYLADQSGNKLRASRVELGNGGAPFVLLPGIRTNGRVTFEAVDAQTVTAPRLIFSYETGDPGGAGCGGIAFHNLPLASPGTQMPMATLPSGASTAENGISARRPETLEREGIRFELTGCANEDTRVVCDYFATNTTANDLKINLLTDRLHTHCNSSTGELKTYVLDQRGKEIDWKKITLADQSGEVLLLPGIHVAGQVIFQVADTPGAQLSRFSFAFRVPPAACTALDINRVPLSDRVTAQISSPSAGALSSVAGSPVAAGSLVRGHTSYRLQGCFATGGNVTCTLGVTSLVQNAKRVEWAQSKTSIVDGNGIRTSCASMHLGADPLNESTLIPNQEIPLQLFFGTGTPPAKLARLELSGNDGTDFVARWANVPVLSELPQSVTAPPSEPPVIEQLPPAKPGDPAGFEVFSVRLYMSASEVVDRLQKKFGVSANARNDGQTQGPRLSYEKDGTHITRVILSNDSQGYKVFYRFLPDSPYKPTGKTELLSMIQYAMKTNTAADVDQFRDSLVEHYGKPSIKSTKNLNWSVNDLISMNFASDGGDFYNTSAAMSNGLFLGAKSPYPILLWCSPSPKQKLNAIPGCTYPIMITGDSTFALYDLSLYQQQERDKQQQARDAQNKITTKAPAF
jgi:hypothetical protein